MGWPKGKPRKPRPVEPAPVVVQEPKPRRKLAFGRPLPTREAPPPGVGLHRIRRKD